MRVALAALTLAAALTAQGVAHAQRVVESPTVAGWGFARCTTVVAAANDPVSRSQIGQWTLGYYSGLLALDVEGAAPAFQGLGNWLRRYSNGGNVAEPIADMVVAQCQATPDLSVEVASHRVAIAIAAEARSE